jgi:hypothetical protein
MAMKQKMTLLASNSEAFPVGTRAWAEGDHGYMTTLAGYEVEDVTYSINRVAVRTALGYLFSINTADYDKLIAG